MKDINNDKFIPTIERWAEFYGQWLKPLARSLEGFASESECFEAVHEAFLKVMGLSPSLKLKKPLEPHTLQQWKRFVWWHARSILGHRREKFARFESLQGEVLARPGNRDRHMAFLRSVICAAVEEVCGKWKDSEDKSKAFIMFKLDELSADEVVATVPKTLNRNNLYQICDRVRRALAKEARRYGSRLWQCRDYVPHGAGCSGSGVGEYNFRVA